MTTIRQACEADLDRLLDLDRIFWEERQQMLAPAYRHTEAPMPPETMRHRVSGEGFRTFVAEDNGQVVGYLAAKISSVPLPDDRAEREGRICDVFVVPDHRNGGIASALYAAATAWFDEQRCVCEGLTVYPTNPALSLYEKWGFATVSVNMRKRR